MNNSVKPAGVDYKRKSLHGQSPLEWGGLEWDIPLVSHIAPNLMVGGVYFGARLPDNIAHVVSLYPWVAYFFLDHPQTYISIRMADSETQDLSMVSSLARWVNTCRETGMVLIHCHAGLNRSALIAATALVVGPEHLTGSGAIALLRAKRHPAALCNPHFERYLTGMSHDRYIMEHERN